VWLIALAVSVVAGLGPPAVGAEASARWSCEPARVEVGEPFELVLELGHPATLEARTLAPGEPELDDSWVLLASPAPETERLADGSLRTRRAWRLASLEPGTRTLTEALSRFAFSGEVSRIAVGGASVEVSGLLGADEDAPRPLREFPDGFADDSARQAGPSALPWILALGGLALLAAGLLAFRRARRRRGPALEPGPLARLGELERGLEGADGRAHCYAVTRLLREAGDRLRKAPHAGLSDEEWLAEVSASHEIPRGIVERLGAVLQRAAEVKYAGTTPTPWALKEILAEARGTLEALGSGGGS